MFFSDKVVLKHIEYEKSFRGVRGHALRKIFKNLHTIVAILVLFEQFLGNFFAPKSECFTKYDAFCSYIFDH